MSISQGTTQYTTIILTAFCFISSAFTSIVAWSYMGMAADVKLLTTSVPRLEDRQMHMVKAADADKALLATVMAMVGTQDKHSALVEQRLSSIEGQLKHLKGFLDYYRKSQ